MIDILVNMMNDPAQQWMVVAILSILLGPPVFFVVRFLFSLPASTQRTLLKIVLVVLFFPLLFFLLACTSE